MGSPLDGLLVVDVTSGVSGQGHDKLSLGLDVTKPGGLQVVLDLARDADLVVPTSRPGCWTGWASATRHWPRSTRGSASSRCRPSAPAARPPGTLAWA